MTTAHEKIHLTNVHAFVFAALFNRCWDYVLQSDYHRKCGRFVYVCKSIYLDEHFNESQPLPPSANCVVVQKKKQRFGFNLTEIEIQMKSEPIKFPLQYTECKSNVAVDENRHSHPSVIEKWPRKKMLQMFGEWNTLRCQSICHYCNFAEHRI